MVDYLFKKVRDGAESYTSSGLGLTEQRCVVSYVAQDTR